MPITPTQQQIIIKCQHSVTWFLRNFGKLKHPSAGIIDFHPFSYQKNAIRQFRTHRLNIFRKCRQCFRGDQMVWGPFGPRRIDSVKSGDKVYSYNEITQRLDIVEIEEIFDNGEREVCEVKSKTGHRSVSTLDHNYFTYNGQIAAKDLTANDRLLEVSDWPRIETVANESEAILLGYLIADGYYGRSNGHFTNTCWRHLLEFQKHYEKRFEQRQQIQPHNRDDGKITSYRVRCLKICIDWLVELGIAGQTESDKTIPDIVFSWDNRSIALFLNRLFAADGWYTGGNVNEVGIGQESLTLLHQIKQLLSRFGIDASIYEASNSSMPKLRIYGGKNFQRFVEEIGIFNKKPRKPITKGFFFNRKKGAIKSVKQTGEVTKVYDIKVPPHHNYVIDGAVVHNSGVSKISGAFATWFAMFHPHKTVLIVSRTNDDAMSFLREHIVFLYEHLPDWMKEVWKPVKQNEHEIIFPNGSRIKSLTSHPDVLRSNASSLNIIDESAFIQGMDVMWSGAWPTLQHGGSVICVSTSNGLGNWYWATWTDAEAGVNGWNPINIDWWDMDWIIKYRDPLSRTMKRIAPRDGIRECVTPEEREKFGPYWSPWLQEQYDALQEQGGDWKFKQEILADFIGSGNTVLPPSVLNHISTTIKNPVKIVTGYQAYVHPVSGEIEDLNFTFGEPNEGLWIWEEPVVATPSKYRNDVVIEQGQPAHSYVMGCDIATGQGKDYSAIEVFDIDTMEQVAEFMARCLPRDFVKFMDRIGRWYNCALIVIERNNGGDILIDLMRTNMMYPRVWRKTGVNDKPRAPGASNRARAVQVAPYGFSTSVASKPTLNKFLLDFIRDKDDDGYAIYSKRLHKQFNTYVRKRDRMGRDTARTEAEEGAGNYDDLVIACALALLGAGNAGVTDASNLVPFGGNQNFTAQQGPVILNDQQRVIQQREYIEQGGPQLLMPMSLAPDEVPEISAQRQLDEYTLQLGGIPMGDGKPAVVPPKFYFERGK